MFVLSVLLFGLRYRVGIDTLRYIEHYAEVKDLFHITIVDYQETDYAPLFVTLFSFCKTISSDFTLFQVVHAFLLNIGVFSFIKNRSANPFLSLSLFFIVTGIVFYTEILRESLAVSVFLLNYKNLENKRWLKYYILSFIAIGFHYSAIITLLVPLFGRIKLNKKFVIYLAIYYGLVIGMVSYINNIGIPIERLAYRYTNQLAIKENFTIAVAYYVGVTIKGIIFPIIILICNRKYGIKQNLLIEPMVLLFAIITATGMAYPVVFDRLSNYFVLFFIVSIANCICVPRFSKSFAGVSVFIMVFIFFLYFNVKEGTLERYYPYSSILDQNKYPPRERLYNDGR